MVVVPLIIEHVPLQLVLSLGLRIGLLLYIRILLLHLFKLVALVVAPRRGPVILPFAHAHPTEVILAHLTRHVVAALVFLDRSFAARTGLCIGHDPSHIFTLSIGLDVP